jgi:hypothetical protein
MKRVSCKTSIGIFLTGLVVAASGPMQEARAEGKTCSDASLKGTYGFSQLGSVVGIAPLPVPAADVGIVSGDGMGNLTGSETVNVGGQVFTDTFANGTYQVNPDCTGTANWTAIFADGRPPQQRSASFVITDNSKEVHFLSTAPGTVLVGTARKQ